MDQITAFLQTRQGWGVIGLVVIGVMLIYSNWSKVKTALPSWLGGTKTGGDVTAIPSRREVLDYLDACYTYFEDVGCKEGMEAMSVGVSHAFHEAPEPPPVQQQAITQLVEAVQVALNKPAQASSVSSPAPDTSSESKST